MDCLLAVVHFLIRANSGLLVQNNLKCQMKIKTKINQQKTTNKMKLINLQTNNKKNKKKMKSINQQKKTKKNQQKKTKKNQQKKTKKKQKTKKEEKELESIHNIHKEQLQLRTEFLQRIFKKSSNIVAEHLAKLSKGAPFSRTLKELMEEISKLEKEESERFYKRKRALDRKMKPFHDKDSSSRSSSDSSSSSTNAEMPPEWFDISTWFLLIGLFIFAWGARGPTLGKREITFKEFNTTLLEKGLVECIEVKDKKWVLVYLKQPNVTSLFSSSVATPSSSTNASTSSVDDPYDTSTSQQHTKQSQLINHGSQFPSRTTPPNTQADYYFSIGSLQAFEEKLFRSQVDLNLRSDQMVPVSYSSTFDSSSIASLMIGLAIVLGLIRGVRGAAGAAGGSSNIFSLRKSPATMQNGRKIKTRFSDVAGNDEAKQEIVEFVDFLKDPARFEKLGATVPKGALLVGPPGCGKTLLAKATAGEAGVPFFSISGSDFIEMFVGVGPARVRSLFESARKHSPSIIFIDEIDAVGRERSKGGFGGNDERENTLNQLLVEMDGFSGREGVVVLAGTNRADILDKALVRPGRFDRQISVSPPDIKGRKQIFDVHLKNVVVATDKKDIAKKLATLTPGFSGADIANACNEGALIAARHKKTATELSDFEAAIERVIGGLEKKSRVLSPREKKVVAYHEAGHAICGWYLEHADPLLKVSIVPRGSAALGYAQLQVKDQYLHTTEQIQDRVCMALGGRIAEKIIFDEITTGASDDLDKITQWTYGQVSKFGMNDTLGNVSFPDPQEMEVHRPYSEKTARMMDLEVRKYIQTAYERTEQLLVEKKDQLELVAQQLLEKEVLQREDMERLIGKRQWNEKTSWEDLTQQ